MKYKKLYNTNIKIPTIGQGCMGIGGYFSRECDNDDKHVKALRLGIKLGMNFIDTAEIYANGHSEELVAMATEGIRDKVFIATKVSPENLSYKDLIRSAKGSLKRLKTDYIDLYQIHWPNPKIDIHETMQAMEQLVEDGKIRHIGVSNFSLKDIKDAEKSLSKNSIVSIQVEYNLFDRTIENMIIPYCEKKGITTIAYSPLYQGRIAGNDEKTKKLEMVANRYNKTIAQIALNWLIMHPTVVAIPKSINYHHIQENAAASDFDILEDDFKELNDTFNQEIVYIPTDKIRIVVNGQENRQAYQTMEDAIDNKLKFVPSPEDLACKILEGDFLKPIKVIRNKDIIKKYDYDLIEGRIRYWAWVIAHRGKKPIPAYIHNN